MTSKFLQILILEKSPSFKVTGLPFWSSEALNSFHVEPPVLIGLIVEILTRTIHSENLRHETQVISE